MSSLGTHPAADAVTLHRWVNAARHRFVYVATIVFVVFMAVRHTPLFASGIVVGSVLALGALGLTVTYGILRFANLGQGVLMMFGAYIAYVLYTGNIRRSMNVFGDLHSPVNLAALPKASTPIGGLSFGYGLIIAMIASAAVIAGLCLIIDRFVYAKFRRTQRAGALTLAIASFGISYVLVGIMNSVWGVAPRSYSAGVYEAHRYPFGIQLSRDQIMVFIAAGAFTSAAYLFLYRTRLGKVMRAMTDNPDLARASGVAVERVIKATWVLVGVTTGASGTLFGLVAPLNPQLGLTLILPLFAAAAVGGLGSALGALAGGLLVGVAQETSVAYVAPGYKISVAFLILAFVLLFKPNGIFGGQA